MQVTNEVDGALDHGDDAEHDEADANRPGIDLQDSQKESANEFEHFHFPPPHALGRSGKQVQRARIGSDGCIGRRDDVGAMRRDDEIGSTDVGRTGRATWARTSR